MDCNRGTKHINIMQCATCSVKLSLIVEIDELMSSLALRSPLMCENHIHGGLIRLREFNVLSAILSLIV